MVADAALANTTMINLLSSSDSAYHANQKAEHTGPHLQHNSISTSTHGCQPAGTLSSSWKQTRHIYTAKALPQPLSC